MLITLKDGTEVQMGEFFFQFYRSNFRTGTAKRNYSKVRIYSEAQKVYHDLTSSYRLEILSTEMTKVSNNLCKVSFYVSWRNMRNIPT